MSAYPFFKNLIKDTDDAILMWILSRFPTELDGDED